jgi:hypothetical protein
MRGFAMRVWLVVSVFVVLVAAPLRAEDRVEPKPKLVKVGKNVVLEINGEQKRVIVQAEVCLTKGPLEGLLTRSKKKEHEYVLAADVDARLIHSALILAGAKAGSPVVFDPKYKPAHGATIKVSLRYVKDKKTVTVPASDFIRHHKTKKPLDKEWVFGGSKLVKNDEDPKAPPFYVANHGDLICVVNMDSAMMDLPVSSPKALNDRVWEANTDKIPKDGTKVEVILEPVAAKKKDK